MFCFLLLMGCLLVTCKKQDPKPDSNQPTFEDFSRFLTKDMDYTAIVLTFGEPDRDIGSGIHIYVYDLEDSTEIWIGYVDKILYARHMDKNRNLLDVLI